MRFSLNLQHRDFFNLHHVIEFEKLLTPEQAKHIKQEAEKIVARRLHLTPAKLTTTSSATLFKNGYDIWRESDEIKKATQKLSTVEIAAELFHTQPLRMGSDQLIITNTSALSPFPEPTTLQDISSIKPLAGGFLLQLENLPDDPIYSIPSFPLPRQAGHGLFIASTHPIPWPTLFSLPHLCCLLMTFAPQKSYYKQEMKDPHSVALKKLGYVFNEPLREPLHPIVYGKK